MLVLVLVVVVVVVVIVCVGIMRASEFGSDLQTGATGSRECCPRVSFSWDLIVAALVERPRISRGLELGPGELTASAGGPGGESRGGPVSFFRERADSLLHRLSLTNPAVVRGFRRVEQ